MKVVLLAGGRGTRIMEESEMRPKPMIEIGGMPIIWHIMKEYSHYGFHDFVICAGYKHYMIKKWFADYAFYTSDMLFDFSANSRNGSENGVKITALGKPEAGIDSWTVSGEGQSDDSEQWRVMVINTGLDTNTGGRIKKIQPYVGNETFLMTYGDGVCDVDISEIVKFHKQHGKLATLTSVVRKQSKGRLDIGMDNTVKTFREKSNKDAELINAGYMVLEPGVFDYLDDHSIFESDALSKLADEGQLKSYRHEGFWQCMDTLQEKTMLESLIREGNAPWIKWE
ncbi:glucose-1-phosphate cytidylyltransferase [[Clostridium] aminophilum]|uniref:glucose-1-phosphate cytidylyltransferase n=1 Tax=[Clostridium] aminophilum TaxID=1526 RepID=UPI003F9735AC